VRRLVALTVAALTAAVAVPSALATGPRSGHAGGRHRPAVYLVGGDAESINPSQQMLDSGQFYLGGYGVTDFKLGNEIQIPSTSGRNATGVLGDGAHSRALAVSDGRHTLELAQIETQGYFAAYKQGPFGIEEIRKDASAAIAALAARAPRRSAPVPTPAEILVDSDHSHGGADTAGVWGGVPTSYLRLVHDRTVAALVNAWADARPATLSYGVAHAGVAGEQQYPAADGDRLLTNQFSQDPANQVVDDEVRVLQARDAGTGQVRSTYVNFSAHPTVLGASNTLVTGDYVGRLDLAIEKKYGGFGFDQVGTLGRTQPNRAGCDDPSVQGRAATDLCALDGYAARVLRKVDAAVAAARPLTGSAVVSMRSYLLNDLATSPALVSLTYAGAVVGAPIYRAVNPPWFAGPYLGAPAFSGRIGDVLINGGPGEMYPQIVDTVRRAVSADLGGRLRGVMNIGTAGDFLGYVIAPLEAYEEPVRRTFLSGSTPPAGDPACSLGGVSVGCPDPIGNDNYSFNGSHTFGERLTCALLRGAGDTLVGDPQRYWSTYPRCAAFADDLVKPAGLDTQFPAQPDLSGVLTH
jgi:hypothetical protein